MRINAALFDYHVTPTLAFIRAACSRIVWHTCGIVSVPRDVEQHAVRAGALDAHDLRRDYPRLEVIRNLVPDGRGERHGELVARAPAARAALRALICDCKGGSDGARDALGAVDAPHLNAGSTDGTWRVKRGGEQE